MKILDKYIAKEFIKGVLLSLATFIFIYYVVDLFEKLSGFIDKKASMLAVIKYYVYQLPATIVLILPVAVLLSLFFTLGFMSRRNELVAIKSAGVSVNRILLPLFVVGFLLSVAVFGIGEGLAPAGNRSMETVKRVELDKLPAIDYKYRRDMFYLGSGGRMYFAKIFDGRKNELVEPIVLQFGPQSTILQRTDARRADWTGEGWKFKDAVVRTFNPERVTHYDEIVMPQLKETPDDFSKVKENPEDMSYWSLRRYINGKKKAGEDVLKESVELNMKLSYPMVNLVIVLFGAPIAASIRKSGAAAGFAASLLISFLYWGLIQTTKALGYYGTLNPLLAAWVSNVAFAGCGIVLLWWARR
jgi:lipopolysaccharide export system permease protein